MTVAIIGMGNFGKAFARALIKRNINIQFGVSDITKYQDAIQEFSNHATLNTVRDAIATADIVVLAVPYHAACNIAAAISDWGNRIVVDVTSPLLPDASGLEIGFNTSGAEQIAAKATNARVVKAFNTIGASTIENDLEIKPTVFLPISGDDMQAKQAIMALAETIGFNAVDAGGLYTARFSETVAMMWIQLAVHQGYKKSFEFGFLRKT